MKWDDLAEQPCSVARTLSVVGDRWTLLILRDCFLGVRRFDEFQQRLGLSRALLTERLKALTDHGVLERRAYQTRPDRYEYVLSASGRELYPVLLGLADWGNRHMAESGAVPLIHHHNRCDQDFRPVTVCSCCGEEVHAREVSIRPGEGFADPRAARLRNKA